MSTLSPTSTNPAGPSNTQRNPPPTLFRAPSASKASLSTSAPSTASTTQRAPLRTNRGLEPVNTNRNRPQAQTEDSRVEALWTKMQLTLEEVEMSALG
ncbi:MAG: hypothetical protein Q9164_004063, partial [Protoblastenia rupestris]